MPCLLVDHAIHPSALYEIIHRNTNNPLDVIYFDINFVPFSILLTSEFNIFCHVSVRKCSKRWALTTPRGGLSQQEALHHRKPWLVCTDCPPWPRSCSKLSAGIAAHSYHCCQSKHTSRHSAALPVSHTGFHGSY